MRFSDLLNPKTAPETLVRLALYPLFILIIGSLVMGATSQLSNTDVLLALFFFILMSPLAYLIREQRERHRQHRRPRRGVERTPLVPPEEDA